MKERRESASPLESLRERLEVRPVGSLEQALSLLPEAGEPWGFWTTPAEARLERLPAPEWRSILAAPRITQARIFDRETDLHWCGGSGVRLRAVGSEEAQHPERSSHPGGSIAGGRLDLVGGGGWLRRERRSRLWGEWLAEAGGWYEERIPDPQRYRGLTEGPQHGLAFLVYREYVLRGAVEHVRYLDVEGEPR